MIEAPLICSKDCMQELDVWRNKAKGSPRTLLVIGFLFPIIIFIVSMLEEKNIWGEFYFHIPSMYEDAPFFILITSVFLPCLAIFAFEKTNKRIETEYKKYQAMCQREYFAVYSEKVEVMDGTMQRSIPLSEIAGAYSVQSDSEPAGKNLYVFPYQKFIVETVDGEEYHFSSFSNTKEMAFFLTRMLRQEQSK